MTADYKIVEAVARALCAHTIRIRRKWDTPLNEVEAMIARGAVIDHAWRDYVGEAQVAITAFQAEVERERQEKLSAKCHLEGFDSKLNWLREYRARTGAPLRLALEAYESDKPLPPAPKASP